MPHLDEWQREMERYLAHFARSGKRPTIVFTQYRQPAPSWTPAVDMYETDDALVAVLELAGVDVSQVEIRAEPHRLVVRGARHERNPAAAGEQRTYHELEIAYGRFECSLALPPGLDSAGAHASYRDGLLEIRLPKIAPHQVRVEVGGGAGAANE